MIATSGFLTALECTKFDFGRGCASDPAGGAYSAPPESLRTGASNLYPFLKVRMVLTAVPTRFPPSPKVMPKV